MDKLYIIPLVLAVLASAAAGAPIQDDLLTVPGVGFEIYLARWWGAPGSEMTRPIYRIARFDTGEMQVHYGIMPGRELADYTMPYWPIRSFLSFVDAPVELAQQVRISYRDGSGTHVVGFKPRSGVELAPYGDALAVRFQNRSVATPEDVTIEKPGREKETNPLSVAQTLLLRKGASAIPVCCAVANTGNKTLQDVSVSLTFEQTLGWSHFGVAEEDPFVAVSAPSKGQGRAFFAFSEGNGRGYVLRAEAGATLTYELEEETNRWRVTVQGQAGTLAPSAEQRFAYSIGLVNAVPMHAQSSPSPRGLSGLDYRRIQPSTFKTAPVERAKRVAIHDMIARVKRPKVRGLNLRGNAKQILADLDTLREWGGNLVIANLGDPSQTADIIEQGHALGLEMLLAGRGGYLDGPPRFETYYEKERPREQRPDSFGQDEDHYYWYAIEPTRSFEEWGSKPPAEASHEDRVTYWADCFVDKWHGVRKALRPNARNADVWFYAPFPGVAHVDPVDSYDLFMGRVAQRLGGALTVFPFYYGIEYDQCEYMMRRWKDCGAKRAVFLPMRDFMIRPSQFIRAITAARRGGADGACGFSIGISQASSEQQWQWKAIMLGAWANFPTRDLDAYSLVEEPADLVEMLAKEQSGVRVMDETEDFDEGKFLAPLFEAFPSAGSAARPKNQGITIVITDERPEQEHGAAPRIPDALWQKKKGFVGMDGRRVYVSGRNTEALQRACSLFLRFVEVARNEAELLGSE